MRARVGGALTPPCYSAADDALVASIAEVYNQDRAAFNKNVSSEGSLAVTSHADTHDYCYNRLRSGSRRYARTE